jgi:3',5'-cyclic AMP phosphodiesterase CpdA
VVGHALVKLDGERNNVRTKETNLGNMVADAMLAKASSITGATIAITNGGGIRSSIGAGDITMAEVLTVMPFGNSLKVLELTGEQIVQALENGVSKVENVDGRFPQVSGLRFSYDPGKVAGSRIIKVEVKEGDGYRLIDPQAKYLVATNSFMANGGDFYTSFTQAGKVYELGFVDYQMFTEYLAGHDSVSPVVEGRIQTAAAAVDMNKIAVLSDPHYFDPALGATGAAFEAYLAKDRKMLAESDAIVSKTIELIKNTDAGIVLVAGDLTKDGELTSHQKFAELLGQLEDSGKKVYVIDGNHDINNPNAFKYDGDQAIPVENVSPEEFKNIYNDFGYGEAIARDPGSLSYVVEPVAGLRIIVMDSAVYGEIRGEFSQDRLNWIMEQTQSAAAQGKLVLGMMHHGLTEHFGVQRQFFPEYVLDDADNVAAKLAGAGMKAVFTGHFHAQDAVKKQAGDSIIYDIETGSLVTYPVPYRLVELTGDGKLAINTSFVETIDYDTGGKPFQSYARDYLVEGISGLAPQMLAGVLMSQGVPREQALEQAGQVADTVVAPSLTVRDLLVNAMVAHYQGDETVDPQLLPVIQGMAASEDSTTKMLGGVLFSLLTDPEPADNNLIIDLKKWVFKVEPGSTEEQTFHLPQDVSGGIIDLSQLLDTSGETPSAILPARVEIKAETGIGGVLVQMPQNLTISGPTAWDGNFNAPSIQSADQVTVPGNASISAVVEVGCGDGSLSFDRAVRLLLPGQAGKRVGYVRGGVFTEIARVCEQDGQTWADASLPAAGEGKIDAGGDLVIWTKHFTKFVSYTQTSSGGGGGGGSTYAGPEVAVYLPQKDVTGAALDAGVNVTFKTSVETVSAASLAGVTIKDASGKPVTGVKAVLNGAKLEISHDSFAPGLKYTVKIPAGAVRKQGTSSTAYRNREISWSFTTREQSVQEDKAPKDAAPKDTAPQDTAPKSLYPDVPAAYWAYGDIASLYQKDLMKGYADGAFRPENNITRAEFTVLLARSLGWQANSGSSGFADADDIPAWAGGYIAAAVEKGVINGYEDNTFRAGQPISRAEIALVLVRAMGRGEEAAGAGAPGFRDDAAIGTWARGYVAVAADQGIVTGKPGNIFAPGDKATRAEAAAMVNRLLNKMGN